MLVILNRMGHVRVLQWSAVVRMHGIHVLTRLHLGVRKRGLDIGYLLDAQPILLTVVRSVVMGSMLSVVLGVRVVGVLTSLGWVTVHGRNMIPVLHRDSEMMVLRRLRSPG